MTQIDWYWLVLLLVDCVDDHWAQLVVLVKAQLLVDNDIVDVLIVLIDWCIIIVNEGPIIIE